VAACKHSVIVASFKLLQAQQWQCAMIEPCFLVLQGIAGTTVSRMQSQSHSSWFCRAVQAQQQDAINGKMQSNASWFCRAVQAQNWQDAIKIYTLAITNCADAPPVFAAVLHSNRAAVHQHLDQYTDAVADSLRAKALDPSYAKVTPLQHYATPCRMCCLHCVQMRQLPVQGCCVAVLLAVTSLWLLQKPVLEIH